MTATRAVRRRPPIPSGAPPIDQSVPLHERRQVVQNPNHRDSLLAETPLTVGDGEERGIISGLANTFSDKYDCYNSRFRPGCFKRTIEERHTNRVSQNRHSKVKILMMHSRWEPIGVALELEEVSGGLRSVGRISCPDEGVGKIALARAADGVLDGLSIGFTEVEDGVEYLPLSEYEENGFDPDDWWTFWFPPRDYVDLDLREYSLVTFPAHDDARIETVVRSFAPQWSGWRPEQPPKGEARTTYNRVQEEQDLAELRKRLDRIDAIIERFKQRTETPPPTTPVTPAPEEDDEAILAELRSALAV